MELETHLRKNWRLLRSADRWRHTRPDEIDKAASRQCRRAVWPVQIRNRDAERDTDARHGKAADRSANLSVLRTGNGERHRLEGADRGAIWRRHHVGNRLRHGDG